MIYLNPYSTSGTPEHFDRSGCKVRRTKCGKGALIKVNDRQYDYVVDGRLVSQRVGGKMEIIERLVSVCVGTDVPSTFLESRALYTFKKQ